MDSVARRPPQQPGAMTPAQTAYPSQNFRVSALLRQSRRSPKRRPPQVSHQAVKPWSFQPAAGGAFNSLKPVSINSQGVNDGE